MRFAAQTRALLSAALLVCCCTFAQAQFPGQSADGPQSGPFGNAGPLSGGDNQPAQPEAPVDGTPALQPSEVQQQQIAAQVEAACKNAIAAVLADFRPHLGDYPELRDKGNLVLYAPHLEFNALAFYNDRQIMITKGLCDNIWLLNVAAAFSYMFSDLQSRYVDYIKYLNSVDAKVARQGAGFHQTEILTFPLYVGFDVASLSDSQRSHIDGYVANAMREAIGFVVAHEIGHLALGHNPAEGAAAREQEFAADAFAIALTEKAGLSAVASVQSMLIFATREAGMKRVPQNTHPIPLCRLQRIFAASASLQKFLADDSQQQNIQLFIGMSVPAYRRWMDDLARYCAAHE